MYEPKLITNAVERLCLAHKQVSVGKKTVEKVSDNSALGDEIEINQNIAAEDQIHARHRGHLRVITQIKSAKGYAIAYRGVHL